MLLYIELFKSAWQRMEACSGQNQCNKMASQVTILASSAFIIDPLCIFVITTQDFFGVLFFFQLHELFFIKAVYFFYVAVWINFLCVPRIIFLVVLRLIFNTSIENYFFIVLIIIFRCIANLFLGLQCFAGLAVEVDWFESLSSSADHFENFVVEECFHRECQGETLLRKETKDVLIFLTKSVRSQ